MELNNDYLTLKSRHLKSPEEMDLKGWGVFFVIVKAGEGTCQGGPSQQRLGAGDVLVVDSAAGVRMEARPVGEMVFWSFAAELEHLFALFSGREIWLLQKVGEIFKGGRVYPASSPLAQQCLRLAGEVPPPFSLDHRSHVLRIVSAILTAELKAAQPSLAEFAPRRDHVPRVFEQLATQEWLSLPVAELARKFNCSRRHLTRLFHQHFGVSVTALRMEMRLLKAVSLLVDPDARIIHVAEKCGFNHLGLFNTCFKRRFGSSPGQWRKRVTQAGRRPAGKKAQPTCSTSDETGAGGNRKSPFRPVQQVDLEKLLRDFTAAKTPLSRQKIGHQEGNYLRFAADDGRDRRARNSA